MSVLDTLAHPLRLRMVRHLEEGHSASLAELAVAAGVHPNTARPHVEALVAAGLLERESEQTGAPGRPRLVYRLGKDWAPPTSDFRCLAELLAAALVHGRRTTAELYALGMEWGRAFAERAGSYPDELEVLARALEQLGYSAERRDTTLVLSGCPCPVVCRERPQVVCRLATGVAQGVLDVVATGAESRMSQRDPERRRCTIDLRAAPR